MLYFFFFVLNQQQSFKFIYFASETVCLPVSWMQQTLHRSIFLEETRQGWTWRKRTIAKKGF